VSRPLLEVRSIRKAFGGAVALADASLTLRTGEVLAVVGENGAGKSTLMKILAGVQPPDAGELLVEGQAVRFTSVADALKHGIALISHAWPARLVATSADGKRLPRHPESPRARHRAGSPRG
jgi:ribose transport system ATP-binding protein